jgi:hypothetical protein
MLQRQGRVSYRALKRQFGLDDEYLEDLQVESIEVHQSLPVCPSLHIGIVYVLTGVCEMGYVYALAPCYCCNNNVLSNGDAPWQRPLRCPGSNRMALFPV